MIDQEVPKSWRHISSLSEGERMVDMGIILTKADAKTLVKALDKDEINGIVRHIALRFAERTGQRLALEILTESIFNLLVHHCKEDIINSFLEEILLHPAHKEACMLLTELALGSEFNDSEYGEKLFAMAVAVMCELGVVVTQIEQQYPGEINQADEIVHHISTYLLSVSNSSNACIRLSLVRYFGFIEKGKSQKPGFNRIMNRFGHTVLENLFSQLFNKKTEGVALQYMMANMPYVLEADNHTQTILHDTLRYYMLKKPSRFNLFINTLGKHLRKMEPLESELASICFLKHLGILVKIASDLNHRELGKEVLIAIAAFKKLEFRDELVSRIRNDSEIKPFFVDMLDKILQSPKSFSLSEIASEPGTKMAGAPRRGRRPSFAKSQKLKPIDQVSFLGQKQMAKAS